MASDRAIWIATLSAVCAPSSAVRSQNQGRVQHKSHPLDSDAYVDTRQYD